MRTYLRKRVKWLVALWLGVGVLPLGSGLATMGYEASDMSPPAVQSVQEPLQVPVSPQREQPVSGVVTTEGYYPPVTGSGRLKVQDWLAIIGAINTMVVGWITLYFQMRKES